MQIHVVKRGQSLYGISQAYGVSIQSIAGANELNLNDMLVVGQALVIPIQGSYYWAAPGDSLYLIGRKFGIDPQTIARVNRISISTPLQIGARLYIPQRTKSPAEFIAYIEPRGQVVSPSLQRSASEAAPHLTYLAPFSFQVNRDGTLTPPLLDNFKQITSANGVTLMMVVSNLEEGTFSADLGHLILTNQQVQDQLFRQIIETASTFGFKDIHFDFEHLYPYDRESYNQFLRKAADVFHRQGWLISTALAPKTSSSQMGEWYTAHDYEAHGEIADYSVLMTYEWGWSGGPPMAVSPIGPVEQVLRYALSVMPAKKIMMGQNLYGYDWTLPYQPGGAFAKAISPQGAINIARRYRAAISYDTRAQAPHFDYYDEQGRHHQVWFEDARSIQAKFNLVKRLGIRGVSYWKLGLPFPQNWLLIEDNFNAVKR